MHADIMKPVSHGPALVYFRGRVLSLDYGIFKLSAMECDETYIMTRRTDQVLTKNARLQSHREPRTLKKAIPQIPGQIID